MKAGWDPAQLQLARKENDRREERLIAEIRGLVHEIMTAKTAAFGANIGEILESSCLIP